MKGIKQRKENKIDILKGVERGKKKNSEHFVEMNGCLRYKMRIVR